MTHCLRFLGALLLTIALHAPIATAIAPPPVLLAQSASTTETVPTWQAGLEQYQQGNYEAAIALWSAALGLAQSAGDVAAEQQLFSGLGAVHLAMDQYEAAVTALQQALALAEQQNDPGVQAQILSNLGIAYRGLGQYRDAIAANQTALALAQSLNNQAMLGQILTNLGNAYEAIGDYERAIAQHQTSLDISRALGDRAGEMIGLNNLGALHARQGNYAEALVDYRQSLALAEQLQNPLGQAYARHNLGSALHSLDDVEQAIAQYQQGLPLAQEAGDRRLEADILASLGLAWEDLDQFDQAEASYQASLAIVSSLESPQAIATVLNNLGHLAFAQSKYDVAIGYLQEAIALFDRLRQDLDDLSTVSVFDTQVLTYNLLQQVFVAQGNPAAALEVAEQGRAQALIERLVTAQTAPTRTNPGTLTSTFTIADIQAIAQATQSTLVEYTIVPHEAFKFQGKQRGRAGELLIWVIRPDGDVRFHQVDLRDTPLDLGRLVLSSRREMGVRGSNAADLPPTEADAEALDLDSEEADEADVFTYRQLRRLYSLLIEPIAAELPTDPQQRVIIVPHEELFLVPFAALQQADGSYLIEHHILVTAPSIQVLALAHQLQSQRSTAPWQPEDWLIVGNPTMPEVMNTEGQLAQLASLPGAEQEATAIAALVQTTPLLGSAATEPDVVERMQQARVIHLATHGLLDYGQTPEFGIQNVPGAIALAPTATADGLLTSSELTELKLQADLAVLSACDTGRGTITGDGVIGLSRSLMTAGVSSVIVSLWAVPDNPTAVLMQTFYQQLQTHGDRGRALRQAMLSTKASYPAPQNWAAFTLLGAPSALPQSLPRAIAPNLFWG